MKVIVYTSSYGWGKGKTIDEARKSHDKFSRKVKVGEQYGLTIYETEKVSNVGVSSDGLNTYYSHGDIILYQDEVTR